MKRRFARLTLRPRRTRARANAVAARNVLLLNIVSIVETHVRSTVEQHSAGVQLWAGCVCWSDCTATSPIRSPGRQRLRVESMYRSTYAFPAVPLVRHLHTK
jgi:hypothetical protein